LGKVEDWKVASDKWQSVLDAPPKRGWFKSTGIQQRDKEPFKSWEFEDVDRKVERLSEVVQAASLKCFVLALQSAEKLR
jgi:hypothetical protein